jgi:tRNA(Arg) A34 adenosine deaminase TadA
MNNPTQAEDFMALAIEASARAVEAGNMPFGAVLVSPEGEMLAVAENNQVSTQDCTGHAEMVLVREVASAQGPQKLKGTTVYASGEPCAMCCGAMFWAGVSKVVYAASQEDITRVLGAPTLPISSRDVLARAEPGMVVDGPLMGAQAVAVLERLRGSAA